MQTTPPDPGIERELLKAPDLDLPLQRFRARAEAKRAVLLLHGASASSETFLVPRHHGSGGDGLCGYLRARGCEVFTLDWRGGCVIAGQTPYTRGQLTLCNAAMHDVPLALARIAALTEGRLPITCIAHCMGAAALAMALGARHVSGRDLHAVVLTSIGLFYDVPWDGWIKADDQALERTLIDDPSLAQLDSDVSRHPWPRSFQSAFGVWPAALLPEVDRDHPFARLTFMFGRPFLEGLLARDDWAAQTLRERFGAMPLDLYIQAGQSVRRRFVAPYDDTSWDADERAGAPGAPARGVLTPSANRYLDSAGFRGPRLTLLTGALNKLWHPDSMRRMYEWLRRDRQIRVEKHILRGYGHQDLYWAERAPADVYPRLLAAIS